MEVRCDVSLFVPSLAGGGAERITLTIAKELRDRGLCVDLLLGNAEGELLQQVPKGVRLINLQAKRMLAALPRLIRYLKSERPKVVLSAIDHANIIAILACKLCTTDTRIVAAVHSTVSAETSNSRNYRVRLLPLLIRMFYPWADAIIAVSKGVSADLTRIAPKIKATVVYNPVVTPELFVKAEEVLDDPWFAPGAPDVILGVGRLVVQKDFCTLIRAFASVRKRRRARLVILGEGEQRSELEDLAAYLGVREDVALPGFVTNPYKYMKRSRVFALSSRWEGLPTVLIEAAALGASIVSTDCPSGPAEILHNGDWGRLVPVGNADALANALFDVLDTIDDIRAGGRACVDMFRTQHVVDEYRRVLAV